MTVVRDCLAPLCEPFYQNRSLLAQGAVFFFCLETIAIIAMTIMARTRSGDEAARMGLMSASPNWDIRHGPELSKIWTTGTA